MLLESFCQAGDGLHFSVFMVLEVVFAELYEWEAVHWEKELVGKEFSVFSEVISF